MTDDQTQAATDEPTVALTAQEKAEQGLELTDADVQELERGPQEPAGADAQPEAAETPLDAGDGESGQEAAAGEALEPEGA